MLIISMGNSIRVVIYEGAISKVMSILVLYRPTQILGRPVQETWFFEGHVQGDT